MSAAVNPCTDSFPPPLKREGRGGFAQSQSENPPQSPFSKGGIRQCRCQLPPLEKEGGGGFRYAFEKSPSFGLRNPALSESPEWPSMATRTSFRDVPMVARSALHASPPFVKGGVHRAVVSFADVQHCNFPSFAKGGWGRIFKIPFRKSPSIPLFQRGSTAMPLSAPSFGKGGWGRISICV